MSKRLSRLLHTQEVPSPVQSWAESVTLFATFYFFSVFVFFLKAARRDEGESRPSPPHPTAQRHKYSSTGHFGASALRRSRDRALPPEGRWRAERGQTLVACPCPQLSAACAACARAAAPVVPRHSHTRREPSIAQLVERWTVVVGRRQRRISIGRWFKSGSRDAFLSFYFLLLGPPLRHLQRVSSHSPFPTPVRRGGVFASQR